MTEGHEAGAGDSAGTEDQPAEPLLPFDRNTTIVFSAAAVLAAIWPVLAVPFAVLSLVLFAIGCVLFVVAFLQALRRSRHEAVTVGGLFGLSTARAEIRRSFHLLTAIQVVVSIATAAVRPFTAQAFGILVPMFGLGIAGWWAAQHAPFGPRNGSKERNV